jgi:hypothetical protein
MLDRSTKGLLTKRLLDSLAEGRVGFVASREANLFW